jgi:hypothetical protein
MQSAVIRSAGLALRHVSMKFPAECFCVLAAALRFLSVAGVIEVIFTASEPARKKSAATIKRKLGGAIRQLHVVAPCTPPEVAVIVREGDA